MEDLRTRATQLRAELQAEMALMDEAAIAWLDARVRGDSLLTYHHEWRVHEGATRRLERRLKNVERQLHDQKGGERA